MVDITGMGRSSNGAPQPTYRLCINGDGQLIRARRTKQLNEDDNLALIEAATEYARLTGVPMDDHDVIDFVLESKRSALPTRTARRRFDAEWEAHAEGVLHHLVARQIADRSREQARLDGVEATIGYLIEFMLEDARSAIPTIAERLRFDSSRAAYATDMRSTAGDGVPVVPMENGSDVLTPQTPRPWPPCSLPDVSNETLIAMAQEQARREGAVPDGDYQLEFVLEMARQSIAALGDRLDFDRYRAASRTGTWQAPQPRPTRRSETA